MPQIHITADHVSSVYSGKPGCACGCRGKHTYNSKHVKWASKRRGYRVTPDEVNDRTVAMIVNKLNASADTKASTPSAFGDHVYLQTDTRLYIAYLRS